jgi:hypothetical protein
LEHDAQDHPRDALWQGKVIRNLVGRSLRARRPENLYCVKVLAFCQRTTGGSMAGSLETSSRSTNGSSLPCDGRAMFPDQSALHQSCGIRVAGEKPFDDPAPFRSSGDNGVSLLCWRSSFH